VDPVDAEDVRDLVRVGDDRGRAEREDEPRELVHHELHGLEVHVRVDEAGDGVLTRRVERLVSVVASESRDDPVRDRDVDLEPLAREHREDASSGDDEIGRFVPARDRETALQSVHRGERNARRAVV
jgi:hypothetical protein